MTAGRVVHDLTADLETHMPVWPTAPLPVFEPVGVISRDGYSIERISCLSHTGTHVDAPFHFLETGATIDEIPPAHWVGRAAVLDLREAAEGDLLPDAAVRRHWPKEAVEIVLFETGWSRRRAATKEYLYQFPGISPDTARWVAEKGLLGVGTDALGIDPFSNTEFAAHKALLGKGLWIAEALDHLDRLAEGRVYTVVVAPLKIRHGSGAMARVLAMES